MAVAAKPSRKSCIFESRRYWYHISTTLRHKSVLLKPYDNSKGFNRNPIEPDVPRICVAPSIAHCLTAVPYCPSEEFVVYRTKSKVRAKKAVDVFDAKVTQEGWIQKPTVFVRVGTLALEDVEKGEGLEHVVEEAASGSEPQQSGKVLKWWKSKNLWKYLKRP